MIDQIARGGSRSRPHLIHARKTARRSTIRLAVLTLRIAGENPRSTAKHVAANIPDTNIPNSDSGGIAKSSVSASRSQSRRTAACQNDRGTISRIVLIWPCSQRLRWLSTPVADEANSLVTRADGQNSGGCPAA